jgi:hypothetical protein
MEGIPRMVIDSVGSESALWMFGLVQLMGLTAAWLSRVSEGSVLQAWAQGWFMLSLVLAGLATAVASGFGPGYWLLSAATLGTMIIEAVCDFRHRDGRLSTGEAMMR